jgi:aminoglycoside phosphotransferase (APT) family kinase protein
VVALSDPLLVQLAERLASRDVSALEPLPGGASSLTYMGRCADRPVVVKVAPPGVRPIAHRDVLRQARVIRSLAARPPVSERAAIYREGLGSAVLELDWFQVLACFKSTATWSLIVKHNRRRTSPHPDMEAMASALPQLLSRARALLG